MKIFTFFCILRKNIVSYVRGSGLILIRIDSDNYFSTTVLAGRQKMCTQKVCIFIGFFSERLFCSLTKKERFIAPAINKPLFYRNLRIILSNNYLSDKKTIIDFGYLSFPNRKSNGQNRRLSLHLNLLGGPCVQKSKT